jgi:four helix bundle protein
MVNREKKRIERFEDLTAWQKARELTRLIYQVSQQGAFTKDFGLSGQIQRAAVSVMSNIAEGFERGSRKDFNRFLSIAKASCAEVCSQLYIAHDIGYLDQTKLKMLLGLAEEVGRIIGGLRASLLKPKTEQPAPQP